MGHLMKIGNPLLRRREMRTGYWWQQSTQYLY